MSGYQIPSDFELSLPIIKIIKEDRSKIKLIDHTKGKDYTYDQWIKLEEKFHEEYIKQDKK